MDTGMHTMPNRRVALERVGGLVTLKASRRTRNSLGSILSGVAQWCGALAGLVLLSPLLGALSLWVRVDSPGPAFFVQERVGRDGKLFRMYKFRTMVDGAQRIVHQVVVDTDAPDRGPLFKARKDHRITGAGRFLRKSSLDELPQLINVVRGDMRLVGPRPALPSEVDKYSGYQHRRLACKPGMTGLWQVSGRSDLDWARSVELDQMYVDGHSLGLDTYIVCRTPGAVFSSRGAY
jgi:lipopolysaccharide/colanic/teichoic acid biosynthesis glycosyltransferase